jgi:hypothetical protein
MPPSPLQTLETRLERIEALVRETWVMVLEMRHPETAASELASRFDELTDLRR